MKATNYRQILKARGYKSVNLTDYKGICIYEKIHAFNTIRCYIDKDSHGKGQDIYFNFSSNILKTPRDMNEFRQAESDRSYLVLEAEKIREYFELLKQMKSPKYIYCF